MGFPHHKGLCATMGAAKFEAVSPIHCSTSSEQPTKLCLPNDGLILQSCEGVTICDKGTWHICLRSCLIHILKRLQELHGWLEFPCTDLVCQGLE